MDAAKPNLTLADVALRLSASTTTIRRLVKAGAFPAPLNYGRAWAWPAEEVAAFIRDRGNRKSVEAVASVN